MLSRSVRSKRMDKPMSAIVGHACAKRHINYHKGIKMPKGTGFGTAAPTSRRADDSGRGPNQMHPENGPARRVNRRPADGDTLWRTMHTTRYGEANACQRAVILQFSDAEPGLSTHCCSICGNRRCPA